MAGFSIALSGLAAASNSLDAISNNLSNLDTDGYKDESVNFASVFNQVQGTSGNGDPIEIGNGVSTASTTSNFSDGNVSSTGVDSNMALQGNGFFIVQGNGTTDYTRNGDFTTNSSGQLVDSSGQTVMGYPATDGVVDTSAALTPITVTDSSTLPGTATSTMQMTTNLDSSTATDGTYSTSITAYDSLGTAQDLTVTYTNTGSNTWSYAVTVPSANVTTGTSTTVASGTMTFDASTGDLETVTPDNGAAETVASGTTTSVTVPITGLSDGASDMSITWNLTDSSGNALVTQDSTTSTTSSPTQNGYAAGTLSSYSISSDGTVEGVFSNGQTLALGQVAVASFANDQGLTSVSGSNYQASAASGAANIGIAGSGGNGTITGGSVEESNVSLSTEFSNLIVAQQGYEANAKALTTLDQVSQATLQMIS
jgi:flagellar hook protein FlgE